MVYAMWTPGDELPEEVPANYEYFDTDVDRWKSMKGGRFTASGDFLRRWPVELPEQRPTAFGLLSEEEQEEIKKLYEEGIEIQFLNTESKWVKVFRPAWRGSNLYRIKPEPEQPEITVTVNGLRVDFRELVRQEVARIQAESKNV